MSVNPLYLLAGALTIALVNAAPVSAFQTVPMPTNNDGSARYVDPDSASDAAKRTDAVQPRYAGEGRYLGDSHGYGDRYIGAKPADDHSYWGSSMLENPRH